MELENTRNRLAILPLCLVAALSVFGCGDDSSPDKKDDTSPVGTDDAGSKPPVKVDAGTTTTDAGPSAPPTAARPDAAGAKPDAGADAVKPDAGSDKPAGSAANTIYQGAPECATISGKVGGTVEGKPVSFDLAALSETTESTFVAQEEGVDRGNVELEWEPDLVPGKASKINGGELELPSTYAFGPYCVVAGEALEDASLPAGGDDRHFFTVTKVKKQVAEKCEGEELVADLKICIRTP